MCPRPRCPVGRCSTWRAPPCRAPGAARARRRVGRCRRAGRRRSEAPAAEDRRGLVLAPQVSARQGHRGAQGTRRQVRDDQGRPPGAHRHARADPRCAQGVRGRRHHDHGRRHAHLEDARRGGDAQGLRVREGRRDAARRLLAGARHPRPPREDGQGVRHQGRHPQPRHRGPLVARAVRRPREDRPVAIPAWACAWTSAMPLALAPTS